MEKDALFARQSRVLLIVISCIAQVVMAADWPQWRGPERVNTSRESGLLGEWPTNGPPLLWVVTGLGDGITSMAIADGKAFTLGYRNGGEFLFALDAATGESCWAARIGAVVDPNLMFGQALMRWFSPRVPTVDGDRV